MTQTQATLIAASAIALIATGLMLLRAQKVRDFRDSWRKQLQHSPEGLRAFHNMMPGFRKMLWQFWRPVTDRQWVPPAIRAEKYMSELDADTRRAVMEWVEKGGEV